VGRPWNESRLGPVKLGTVPDDSTRKPRYLRNAERTQETQPKKGKPVEIPVPTREEIMRDLAKVAPPAPRPDAEHS
jgi:hypothetical protein